MSDYTQVGLKVLLLEITMLLADIKACPDAGGTRVVTSIPSVIEKRRSFVFLS